MTGPGEQLTLAGLPAPRARRRPRAANAPVEPAERAPVARVAIDLPPAHLDRTFEYLVPAALADAAVPGTRVKVRFGAQDVDGYVLERVEEAEHEGALVPLRKVVSSEPVLTPAVMRLARAVADRYAGTLADVLRLAVPLRHARVESEDAGVEPVPTSSTVRPSASAWVDYRGGAAFLQHLGAGASPRAVWTALPGTGEVAWPVGIAQAVAATVLGGRGALVVVPDARDVERVCAALSDVGLGAWTRGTRGGVVRLMADDGPAARYRSFLAARRGVAQVVVGTRASAFAPVADLGLVVCWDDGDSLHAEPRSPYPHVREVLALRADLEEAALLLGSHTRTVESQVLVESGWARQVVADRATVRARTPRVQALTAVELAREGAAAAARLPAPAWRVLRDALGSGPVLVQVPRAGYVPAVACGRCRTVARCATCHGPLGLDRADGSPTCRWCGRLATGWRCGECGAGALRSVRVGSERTAEELGRAFPQVPVRVSGARAAAGVLASVPDSPALVVSTPGAEPVAPGGYAAAVLLDAAVATAGTSLRAGEDALRRWLTAAALVRPLGEGGQVVLVGDAAPRPTQALVRWDPVGFAARELAERVELGLPPAVRTVSVRGPRDAVSAVLARLVLPEGADVLGPVVVADDGSRSLAQGLEPDVQALVRAPRGVGAAVARTVAASLAVRSAHREGGAVRVQVDPPEPV
ncbi:primosomal protein N' [Cellulomonas soli]